jgi:Methylase involved in ubiquinone/menaquinone biosynthesis
MKKTYFRPWIDRRRIVIFFITTILLLLAPLIFDLGTASKWLLWITSIPFAFITFRLIFTYNQLAPSGGNYQEKIYDVAVDYFDVSTGSALDIGTLSGAVPIKLAKKYPKLKISAVDNWRDKVLIKPRESKNKKKKTRKILTGLEECQNNAEVFGVSKNIKFTKHSLGHLPYKDSEFNGIISVLSFQQAPHDDKLGLLREALRILEEGGEFVFIDLFNDESTFGNLDDLLTKLKVSEVEAKPLSDLIHLPKLLMAKSSLGNAVLIKGHK